MKTKLTHDQLRAMPLSDLIDLAVTDAQACARNRKKFVLDMTEWIAPNNGPQGQCAVCLAGALLVRSGDVTSASFFDLGSNPFSDIAMAINRVRTGYLANALTMLNRRATQAQIPAMELAENEICGGYKESQERASWTAYRRAAAILRKVGL